MNWNGLSLDSLVDLLAERVAAKVCAELAQANNGPTIRPRLMTVEQAADYIGRSKDAMQHMVSDGKIPTVRLDRRVFVDVQDADRWIEEHKQAGV